MSGMGRTLLSLLGMAMAAGLAVPAASAQTPKADPPPPASLEVKDVEAWASAYLNRDAWVLITHDIEGAHFARPHGGKATSPHMIEAEIRTELFRPVQMGQGPARSGLARWSVDCATARYAVLSMTIFSHNNLQGELARKASADRTWMTPIDSQVATISVLCKSILGGAPLERPLQTPRASPS